MRSMGNEVTRDLNHSSDVLPCARACGEQSAAVEACLEVSLVNAHKVLSGAAGRELAISIGSGAEVHIWHPGAMIPQCTALLLSGIAEVLHLQHNNNNKNACQPGLGACGAV